MEKEINIKYFALFREQAAKSSETISTSAETVDELFQELSQKYKFSLNSDQVRVSINEEFKDMTYTLSSHDCIVFIPPVAGG